MNFLPYFLHSDVGPWEDTERSRDNLKRGFENNELQKFQILQNEKEKQEIKTSNLKQKLPSITPNNRALNYNSNYAIQTRIEENLKSKRNFLKPKRKQQTMHIQEMEQKIWDFQQRNNEDSLTMKNARKEQNSSLEKDNGFAIKGNRLFEGKKELEFFSKNKKQDSPTVTIEKNDEYFTPNISSFKTKKNVEKSLDSNFSNEIIVKGKLMTLKKTNSHLNANNSSFKNERKENINDNSSRRNQIIDEKTKIRLHHLKKIEKNSMHFLQFFLLKYEQDADKMKKFLKKNILPC